MGAPASGGSPAPLPCPVDPSLRPPPRPPRRGGPTATHRDRGPATSRCPCAKSICAHSPMRESAAGAPRVARSRPCCSAQAGGALIVRDVLRRLQRGELTIDEAQAELAAREVAPSRPPMGTVVRRESARPRVELVAIALGLVAVELLFALLFLWGLLDGWSQRPLALLLGAMFLTLGVITDVYRRGFLPDRLVVKRRRDKILPRQD